MVIDGTTIVIIIIILLAFFVTFLTSAEAEHDYFESHIIWESQPQICIQDIPREDLYLTLRAINQWDKAFENYLNEYNVLSPVRIIGEDINGCNIVIIQVDNIPPRPGGGVNPVGLTSCHSTQNVCVIRVDRDFMGGLFYHDIIVHEMGHAIGLGHRLAYGPEGMAPLILAGDIMTTTTKLFLTISRESIDALVFFYTDDNAQYNYTIPHNTSWDDPR